MDPSLLRPAELLHWSISSESAKDIDIAKKNLDKCVCVCVCVFKCVCVCVRAFCDSLLRESISSSTTSRKVREGLAYIINISIRSY